MDVSGEKEEEWDEGIGEGRASLMGHWVWELTLAPCAKTRGKTGTVGCWFVGAVWPPTDVVGG